MGHAPSSECCNHEPFVVDFESKGKGHERLAAIALTKHNIIDSNSPFFRGLYAARSDESVRHWYCSDIDRSTIKPAPSADFIYQKFVSEPSEYVSSVEDQDPTDFTPLPIALVRLPQDAVLYHENGQLLTSLELLGTNPNFEVVGYFGCRQFSAGAKVDNHGVIGMFLSKTFNNEAKSVAIMEIACKCYKHFMSMYGLVDTPWPSEVHFDTLDSNLPCLRLMQKLLVSSHITADESELIVTHDTETQRLKVVAKGSVVARFAEHLAAQVTTQDSITFNLKTRPVEPAPSSVVHPKLDEVIGLAKKKWSEANRAVVEAYGSAKQLAAKSETASVASMAPASIGSSSSHNTVAQQHNATPAVNTAPFPSVARSTYRHSVYDVQVLDIPSQGLELEQEEEEHQQQYFYNQTQAPVEQEVEVEESVGLYLAKRTPISYWKKGNWSNAQWRDEVMVKLCSIQHAESDGLFAVELMYPSSDMSSSEISIFDEYNRPAKVKLDRPSIFYVPTNSLYHRDLATKQYIPFSVGTEIAPQHHEILPQNNTYRSEQEQSYSQYGQQDNSSQYNTRNVYHEEQRRANY